MKRFLSIALSLCLLVLTFSVAVYALPVGTTYYIDSVGGSDLNGGGSPSDAWQSIGKASALTYAPGDKILFKTGGTYVGTFSAKGNGAADAPITLGSYGDAAAGRPLIFTRWNETLVILSGVSFWTVENLEFSAPDGRGLHIGSGGGSISDITVKNCSFHNIWYHQTSVGNAYYAPIFIESDGKNARFENLTLSGLDFYDCAYGIVMAGNTIEWAPHIYVSPEESYAQNFLYENISMHNILYDGMIICSINNLLIRNCTLIKTSLYTDYYTAPLWMHHANNVTVENCEIAGSTNYKDGMTVDFDGWTTNSTYQYIYSHDNIRFMQNCVYDNTTRNENCTVRYCLSVNDNVENNNITLCNSPSYTDEDNPTFMDNFHFYNNTIINGSRFRFSTLRNSVIQNNIFAFSPLQEFVLTDFSDEKYFIGNVFSNNCFYRTSIPLLATESIARNPLFTSDDTSKRESFILSKNSPLIGAGVTVCEDMGEFDFYGTPLASIERHNIGCYEGNGADDGRSMSFGDRLLDCVYYIFGKMVGSIAIFNPIASYF